MTLLSIAAQNASLDNDYGATKGSNAPASHVLMLYMGDPLLGGTELASDGGYVRTTVTNNGTNWPGAVGGSTTSAEIPLGFTSTGPLSDTATFFVLANAADPTELGDSGPLTEEISIDEAGVDISLVLTIFYDGGL